MAIVVAIVISLAGLLALSRIPVAQLPDIVPPQVRVSATYPGASAAVLESAVAQPIESKVIGVDKTLIIPRNADDSLARPTTLVADAHAPDVNAKSGVNGILHHRGVVLHPVMNIQEAIAVFDAAEAESLVVVEAGGEHRPVGILTEAHAMRRYAEESEQRRREAVGDIR